MPPKLPPDALTAPPRGVRAEADPMPSPFDEQVIASAPPPTPSRAALNPAMWMGKQHFPLVKPEHQEELEQLAAVNEFSRRMPREKAEAEAYAHYRDKQHKEASVHHWRGMKAAHASGDEEAARKHSLMYGLHSKALGHEAVGPAHPDVQAALGAPQDKFYHYKAHKGDMLALTPHTTTHGATASAPAPQLGKAEVDALLVLRKACAVLTKGDVVQFPGNPAPAEDKGAEAPVHAIDPRGKRKVGAAGGYDKFDYSDHLDPSWQNRGIKLMVFHHPPSGSLSASIVNGRGAIQGTYRRLGPEKYDASLPFGRLPDHAVDALMNAMDAHAGQNGFEAGPPGKGPVFKKEKEDKGMEGKSKVERDKNATTCPDCGKYKPYWAQRCLTCYKDREGLGKAEKLIRDGGACRCESYKFPHRRGGGHCPHKK